MLRSPSVVACLVPLHVAAFTVFSATACGNDFDALFANAYIPTIGESDGGPDASSASSEGGADGGSDAADGAPTCPPPAIFSLPGWPWDCAAFGQGCSEKDCKHTCAGCGCACHFDCASGGAESCATTCNEGTTCTVSCDLDGPCNLTARGAASATLNCKGDEDTSCTVDCQQSGFCQVDCANGGACSVTCAAGTTCLVHAPNRTPNLRCSGAEPKKCNNDFYTCSRDCP